MFINYFIHILIIVKIENALLKLPLKVDSFVYTRIYMSFPMWKVSFEYTNDLVKELLTIVG